jgi:hypothetical protein
MDKVWKKILRRVIALQPNCVMLVAFFFQKDAEAERKVAANCKKALCQIQGRKDRTACEVDGLWPADHV